MKVTVKSSPLLDASVFDLRKAYKILAAYSPAVIELALYMTTDEGKAEMDRISKQLEGPQ